VWDRQVSSRRRAKKALILGERSVDANVADLARLTGISLATISRRHDAAMGRSRRK
jgi:hypothetical protein